MDMHLFSEPKSLSECIGILRKTNNFTMPSDDREWFDFDRQEIDIRRSHVLQDALKEGHKRRFDPTKLLNVLKLML